MGLDLIDFYMTVEKRFDIHIPDDDAAELRTVRAVTDYLLVHPAMQGWTRDQIEYVVREIAMMEMGLVMTFSSDADFVRDLGAG